MNQLTLNLQPERRIYTVSDLTARIRELLGQEFHGCHRAGEISNCRPASSGHYYFNLKDERAQCAACFSSNSNAGMNFC